MWTESCDVSRLSDVVVVELKAPSLVVGFELAISQPATQLCAHIWPVGTGVLDCRCILQAAFHVGLTNLEGQKRITCKLQVHVLCLPLALSLESFEKKWPVTGSPKVYYLRVSSYAEVEPASRVTTSFSALEEQKISTL